VENYADIKKAAAEINKSGRRRTLKAVMFDEE